MSDDWNGGNGSNVRPMRPADYAHGRPIPSPPPPPGATVPPPTPGQGGLDPAAGGFPQGQSTTGAISPLRLKLDELAQHPYKDLFVGAVVGAAALWGVPKLLEAGFRALTGQGGEYDYEDWDE